MVKELQPFIVTSWHGHRDDADLPEVVRRTWKGKFAAPSTGRFGLPRHSNVDLAVLDPDGKLVHVFDGFPPRRSPGESLGDYTVRHLRYARSWLEKPGDAKQRAMELPDLAGRRGIRVLVTLKDDRMTAYQAPVVEAVALEKEDWKPLAYPEEPRTVKANLFPKWLSQVYPPGVMERTDPRTKKVYEVKDVEGTLTLAPAGADHEHRYAILRGELQFTDEGADGFHYEGMLEVVLTYPKDDATVDSLRGVFEGTYPREDRRHGRTRGVPLQAVFESRPE